MLILEVLQRKEHVMMVKRDTFYTTEAFRDSKLWSVYDDKDKAYNDYCDGGGFKNINCLLLGPFYQVQNMVLINKISCSLD